MAPKTPKPPDKSKTVVHAQRPPNGLDRRNSWRLSTRLDPGGHRPPQPGCRLPFKDLPRIDVRRTFCTPHLSSSSATALVNDFPEARARSYPNLTSRQRFPAASLRPDRSHDTSAVRPHRQSGPAGAAPVWSRQS
jgi:hypothetical protein